MDHVNFISQPFYYLNLKLKKDNKEVSFNWERGKLFDKYIVGVLYEFVMEDPVAKVIGIEKKQVTKYKPYPMTTIDLQKMASSKLKISSA